MPDPKDTNITTDMSNLFGFDDMSDEEKTELLDNIGSVIVESSILRFVTEAKKEDVEAFNAFIESHGDDDDIFLKLVQELPELGTILEEEVASFRTETEEVLDGRPLSTR